jgi:hypothetical protein
MTRMTFHDPPPRRRPTTRRRTQKVRSQITLMVMDLVWRRLDVVGAAVGTVLLAALVRWLIRALTAWSQREAAERLVRKVARLRACQRDLVDMITKSSCNPIMLRLAFSDAGTFDRHIREWPDRGGANGSVRFDAELAQTVNAGLSKAIALLQPVKKRNPTVSWADLIQMAGAKVMPPPHLTSHHPSSFAPHHTTPPRLVARPWKSRAARASRCGTAGWTPTLPPRGLTPPSSSGGARPWRPNSPAPTRPTQTARTRPSSTSARCSTAWASAAARWWHCAAPTPSGAPSKTGTRVKSVVRYH